MAIPFFELSFNQLSAPCSNPAVFWPSFSPTIRYHHDLSMTLDWVHSFIHSVTDYLLNTMCRHGARCWVAMVNKTQSLLFFLRKHMRYAVHGRPLFFPMSVVCFFVCFTPSPLVSKLIPYLCLAAGGPLSRETSGAISIKNNTDANWVLSSWNEKPSLWLTKP